MTTSFTNKKKQQTDDLSQLMPQNIDAEEAILGAILVSPSCMNKVVEHLRPESFYKPAHRYVYEAMLQLYNGEDKIDIVSVSDVLNINQKLELVGGRAFINDLSYKTITSNIILKSFRKKQLSVHSLMPVLKSYPPVMTLTL